MTLPSHYLPCPIAGNRALQFVLMETHLCVLFVNFTIQDRRWRPNAVRLARPKLPVQFVNFTFRSHICPTGRGRYAKPQSRVLIVNFARKTAIFQPSSPPSHNHVPKLVRSYYPGFENQLGGWPMTAASPSATSFPIIPFAAAAFGIASFSLMDAVMKGLAIKLGAYDAVFWRNLAGLLICAPVYFAMRPAWPSRNAMKLHLLRGTNGGLMAFTFFWGIVRVPLAEGIALSFIAPLVALYLAAVFLGEKVHPRIILASIVSFAGVIVIAAGRAQGEFDSEAIWGISAILASSVMYAGNIVLMRAQAQAALPVEIVFWQSGIVAFELGLVSLILPMATPWSDVPEQTLWWPLIGSALLTVISLSTLAWAYARAQMQALVTTEYTAFIWASLLGWWWFAEALAVTTVAGCVLIVAGCVVATTTATPKEPV